MLRKLVRWEGERAWMFPIGGRTINRDRSLGLELLTCRLDGGADEGGDGMGKI